MNLGGLRYYLLWVLVVFKVSAFVPCFKRLWFALSCCVFVWFWVVWCCFVFCLVFGFSSCLELIGFLWYLLLCCVSWVCLRWLCCELGLVGGFDLAIVLSLVRVLRCVVVRVSVMVFCFWISVFVCCLPGRKLGFWELWWLLCLLCFWLLWWLRGLWLVACCFWVWVDGSACLRCRWVLGELRWFGGCGLCCSRVFGVLLVFALGLDCGCSLVLRFLGFDIV